MFDSMVVGREIYFQLSMVGDEEVSSQWLQQRFLVNKHAILLTGGMQGRNFRLASEPDQYTCIWNTAAVGLAI